MQIKTTRGALAVQLLGLRALIAEGLGSIPGRGTEIPQDLWHDQNKTEQNNEIPPHTCQNGYYQNVYK